MSIRQAFPDVQADAPTADDSYQVTKERFSRQQTADIYPARYSSRFRDQRERACLLRALSYVPPGETVLDLPCGAGRVTQVIAEAGFRACAADASAAMLQVAERNWRDSRRRFPEELRDVSFEIQDVMRTTYSDRQFGGVLCNRLFHHFRTPDVRIAALKELRRIVRHTLIVSFFNSFALDALRFRLKHVLRGTTPQDRIPIPFAVFASDLRAAGFDVVASHSVLPGVSPLCYVIAKPANVEE